MSPSLKLNIFRYLPEHKTAVLNKKKKKKQIEALFLLLVKRLELVA